MPYYEYKCEACGFTKTEERKIVDRDKNTMCKKCISGEMKRLIPTGTSFILKGAGWARHGYSKNGRPPGY